MRIEIPSDSASNVLVVEASGKLSKQDYDQLVPTVEKLIQQSGKIRVLFEMHDFHGWTAAALWEDTKFDLAHFKDIDRVALVGEARWEAWMATVCKPFTAAQVRYFDRAQIAEARRWLADESALG